MDVGFLFGWAKEQGVKVPQKPDGSANINELFALYNEWKKKGEESKAEEESLLLNIEKNKFTGKYNFYTITVDDGE